MRPVRGADFDRRHVKCAELVSVRHCDGVLSDALLDRMVFEGIHNPDGDIREATRENSLTPKPNTHGRDHIVIPVLRMDADFVWEQTHPNKNLFDDRNKLVANVDIPRLGISFSELESELKHLLVVVLRQLRHSIDDRALYGR